MGRPKRNAGEAGIVGRAIAVSVAKKARKDAPATAAGNRSRRASGDETVRLGPKRTSELEDTTDAPISRSSNTSIKPSKATKKGKASNGPTTTGASKASKATKTSKAPKVSPSATEPAARKKVGRPRKQTSVSVEVPNNHDDIAVENEEEEAEDEDEPDGVSYWLMKAEPESRIEKGVDVKFSIDDLKAKGAPEAWDGVRSRIARNNMRAMMKGDLAFFYHSNCRTPGIAGIMEIVQEHSVDESAFDENHPYYDPKSTRDQPQWDLVHVAFRSKFKDLVKLKDLQKFARPGGVLANLQTLKQSRLSVSKVSKKEWEFILGQAEIEDEDSTVVVASAAA